MIDSCNHMPKDHLYIVQSDGTSYPSGCSNPLLPFLIKLIIFIIRRKKNKRYQYLYEYIIVHGFMIGEKYSAAYGFEISIIIVLFALTKLLG